MRHQSTGPVCSGRRDLYVAEVGDALAMASFCRSFVSILVDVPVRTHRTPHVTGQQQALGLRREEFKQEEWMTAIRCLVARTSRGPLKTA